VEQNDGAQWNVSTADWMVQSKLSITMRKFAPRLFVGCRLNARSHLKDVNIATEMRGDRRLRCRSGALYARKIGGATTTFGGSPIDTGE